MNSDMLDRSDIKEDLIKFINIIKELKNGYEFIEHNDINYIDYEAMDYEYSHIEYVDLNGKYEVGLMRGYIDKNNEITYTWLY